MEDDSENCSIFTRSSRKRAIKNEQVFCSCWSSWCSCRSYMFGAWSWVASVSRWFAVKICINLKKNFFFISSELTKVSRWMNFISYHEMLATWNAVAPTWILSETIHKQRFYCIFSVRYFFIFLHEIKASWSNFKSFDSRFCFVLSVHYLKKFWKKTFWAETKQRQREKKFTWLKFNFYFTLNAAIMENHRRWHLNVWSNINKFPQNVQKLINNFFSFN